MRFVTLLEFLFGKTKHILKRRELIGNWKDINFTTCERHHRFEIFWQTVKTCSIKRFEHCLQVSRNNWWKSVELLWFNLSTCVLCTEEWEFSGQFIVIVKFLGKSKRFTIACYVTGDQVIFGKKEFLRSIKVLSS